MGDVEIPDGAWRGVLDFGIDGVSETVEAATPIIARAAQVQILRETADELELFMNATRTRSTVGIGWKDGTKEAIKAMHGAPHEREHVDRPEWAYDEDDYCV